jgi:hypothetical protein
MTLAKLYEEAARVAKLIENTPIQMSSCVKQNGYVCGYYPQFTKNPSDYEFCLAIVENKPVFKGDEIYDGDGCKIIVDRTDGVNIYGKRCNLDNVVWYIKLCSFQPKPKTVMVELLREDAEYWSSYGNTNYIYGESKYDKASKNFYQAVKKSLEG